MKFLVGTKQHMTHIFDADGRAWPATVLLVPKAAITAVKTNERDGYTAVQVGYGERKKKNVNKAQSALGTFAGFKEFLIADTSEAVLGNALHADVFVEGDSVTVSAISKGKGFQGVVKRHRFAGGRRSHGQKHSEREPGSIGATGPQRVFKGTRMAGRMGGNRVTVKNLKVLQVDTENGTLVISGAIPGRRGTIVEIRGTGI